MSHLAMGATMAQNVRRFVPTSVWKPMSFRSFVWGTTAWSIKKKALRAQQRASQRRKN